MVCQQRAYALAAELAADPRCRRAPQSQSLLCQALPRARDVALLVEVSDTTYAKDSGPKLRRYASFRIPVYWIVNLNRRIVEVRTGPFSKGKPAGYAVCHTYREGDTIPVELDGQEVGRVAVSDLLP